MPNKKATTKGAKTITTDEDQTSNNTNQQNNGENSGTSKKRSFGGRKPSGRAVLTALRLLKDRFHELKDESMLRAELSRYCDASSCTYFYLRSTMSKMNSKARSQENRRRKRELKEQEKSKSSQPESEPESEGEEEEQEELGADVVQSDEITEFRDIQAVADRKLDSYTGISDVTVKLLKFMLTAKSDDGSIDKKDKKYIAYVQAAIKQFEETFFDEEQPEDSALISFDDKIKVLLSPKFTSTVQYRQYEDYYKKLSIIVQQATLDDINKSTIIENIEIFQKLQIRGSLGNPLQTFPKMTLLLLRQNQIRTTYREVIQRAEADDDKHLSKLCIRKMLKKFFKLDPQTIQIIIQNPDKLLWDSTIKNLLVIEHSYEFAKVVADCHDGKSNPTEKLMQIYESASPRIWITKYLQDSDYTQGCTLQDILYSLDWIKTWTPYQQETDLMRVKFKNIISESHKEVQVKTVLTHNQCDKLDEFSDQEAKKLDIDDTYQKILKISKRFKDNADGYYEHRKIACLIAAQAVSSTKQATYVQVETGNGKTFIMLLAAAFLKEVNNETVVYVARDEINERQVNDKCKVVGLNLMVTVYDDVGLLLESDKTFILDEYYAQIAETKITINEVTGLNPIFKMGVTYKAIMTSAHSSDKFQMWLKKFFGPKNVEVQLHQSLQGKVGQQQEYSISVECEGEDYMSKAIQAAGERAQEQPIITFNLEHDKFDSNLFKLPKESLVVDCQNHKQVMKVQDVAAEFDKAVVNMIMKHGVGTDIKFKVDALVIIALKGPIPDSEFIKQLVSRGCRSMGKLEGVIYCDQEKKEQRWIEQQLKKFEGADFKDGAFIARGLLKYMDGKTEPHRYKWLAESLKGEWMTTLTELDEALPASKKEAVMKCVLNPYPKEVLQKKKKQSK